MARKRNLIVSIAIGTGTFLAMMYWYQWSSSPLRQEDIARYLGQIEAQTHEPGGRHDMQALRSFLESDDGKPVYTVNMYEFNTTADYPDGSPFSGTGTEAFERFSSVMIKLMAARGSHPVFGSTWADSANSEWDRIVVVRYRSRRDLADLFATDAFAEASQHKWASIRRHDRMLVTALHIPGGEWLFFAISLLAGTVAYGIIRFFKVF